MNQPSPNATIWPGTARSIGTMSAGPVSLAYLSGWGPGQLPVPVRVNPTAIEQVPGLASSLITGWPGVVNQGRNWLSNLTGGWLG